MIVGNLVSFKNEDCFCDVDLLIELTSLNENGKNIEIAFDHGKERIYLQFILSDLIREVKEMKDSA